MTLPRVEVTWIDSAFHRGWSDADTKRAQMGMSECRTVGYLLSKTRESVKLVMSTADENDSFSDGITIPRACVRTMKRLR